jgi:hypothetical protein
VVGSGARMPMLALRSGARCYSLAGIIAQMFYFVKSESGMDRVRQSGSGWDAAEGAGLARWVFGPRNARKRGGLPLVARGLSPKRIHYRKDPRLRGTRFYAKMAMRVRVAGDQDLQANRSEGAVTKFRHRTQTRLGQMRTIIQQPAVSRPSSTLAAHRFCHPPNAANTVLAESYLRTTHHNPGEATTCFS